MSKVNKYDEINKTFKMLYKRCLLDPTTGKAGRAVIVLKEYILYEKEELMPSS